MHARAKVDEDFRSELDLLQYVSNALESAALLGTLSSRPLRPLASSRELLQQHSQRILIDG
jgi:hypothetical protein